MSDPNLKELARKLKRGDRRELALILGVHPSKVTNAIDGFVKDPIFCSALGDAMQRLVDSRQAIIPV